MFRGLIRFAHKLPNDRRGLLMEPVFAHRGGFEGRNGSASMARVLLAEDDDAVRDMLRAALERCGFDVVAVAGVRDALRCIATERFDVLLSDLHMPHAGDGFTVVSAMRHTHPDAVTIVLSGYPEIEEALAAIRSQADEVLVKPIGIDSLREIIHKRLAAPRLHRTLKPWPPYWSAISRLRLILGWNW